MCCVLCVVCCCVLLCVVVCCCVLLCVVVLGCVLLCVVVCCCVLLCVVVCCCVLVTCSTVCMSTAVNAMQQSVRLIEFITCMMSSYSLLIIMQSASHVQFVGILDVNACMGNNQKHRLIMLLHSEVPSPRRRRKCGNLSRSQMYCSITCIHCRTKCCAPSKSSSWKSDALYSARQHPNREQVTVRQRMQLKAKLITTPMQSLGTWASATPENYPTPTLSSKEDPSSL